MDAGFKFGLAKRWAPTFNLGGAASVAVSQGRAQASALPRDGPHGKTSRSGQAASLDIPVSPLQGNGSVLLPPPSARLLVTWPELASGKSCVSQSSEGKHQREVTSISGLVVEYIVAIDVTRA